MRPSTATTATNPSRFETEMCGSDMEKVSEAMSTSVIRCDWFQLEPVGSQVGLMDFIPWATNLRDLQREQVRNQRGFGKDKGFFGNVSCMFSL